MRLITGAAAASLVLALGDQVRAQDQHALVVTDLRGSPLLAAAAVDGKPTPISRADVKLPARIVSVDARKVAEVVDGSGRHLWMPLRELVTAGPSSDKVGPCTGDQTRGVRGIRPC